MCDDPVMQWRPDDDSPIHVNHDCCASISTKSYFAATVDYRPKFTVLIINIFGLGGR